MREAEVRPAFYEPFERLAPEGETGVFFSIGNYIFRSRLDPDLLREPLMRLGREMSPAVDLWFFNSIEADLYRSTAPRRVMMWLLITMGGLGLLMSALGIYAVMAYAVTRRTREVGIRMAMGAQRAQVRGLFVRHGARLIVNGIVLGNAAAITVGIYMESVLYGVKPTDPWVFMAVGMLLAAVALFACWLPARRATKVDPMAALRYE